MRVLSIIHYPVFGGPHNRNLRLRPILSSMGVDTTVLLPNEEGNASGRLKSGGIDVVQMPLSRIRASYDVKLQSRFFASFPGQVRAIARVIREVRADVVQLNGFANPHGAFAARATGTPLVWQILDTYTPKVLRAALRPLITNLADSVMCTGERVARMHPGVSSLGDRVFYFFPPVDTDIFRASPEVRSSVRHEFGFGDDELVVGTLGNINLQKGHDDFVRAAASLKYRIKKVRFLILGVQHENHQWYIDRLWGLAGRLGLKKDVDLIVKDPTGRVPELMQAIDIFWMTPRPNSEGIPTAMEEAMALEIPVVSFNVGAIAELVVDGRSGWVVEHDPQRVADITYERLMHREVRVESGKVGRERVVNVASLQACAQAHLHAYEFALGRHRL